MGKVSFLGQNSQPQIPTDQSTPVKNTTPIESNILPELTKKEWFSILTAVFFILFIGCLLYTSDAADD